MTELEAQAIINLHRAHRPSVVHRSARYVLRADKSIEVYRVTKSGKRAIYQYTTADPRDRMFLPREAREVWFGSENGKSN